MYSESIKLHPEFGSQAVGDKGYMILADSMK